MIFICPRKIKSPLFRIFLLSFLKLMKHPFSIIYSNITCSSIRKILIYSESVLFSGKEIEQDKEVPMVITDCPEASKST